MLVIAQDLFVAARVEDRQGRAVQRDVVQIIGEPAFASGVPETLQTFLEGLSDGLRFGLSGQFRQLCSQRFRQRISDIQGQNSPQLRVNLHSIITLTDVLTATGRSVNLGRFDRGGTTEAAWAAVRRRQTVLG